MRVLRLASIILVALSLGAGQPAAALATLRSVQIVDFGFVPKTQTVQLLETVQWTNDGDVPHNVTTDGNMPGSFISNLDPNESSSATTFFSSAGKWRYRCTIHPKRMRGTINVPIETDATTRPLGLAFNLTWADDPGVSVNYDVQVRKPGSDRFVSLFRNEADSGRPYTPNKKGKYRLRARIQENNDPKTKTDYSAPIAITVT